MKELVNIDIDLVRELKRNGNYPEAMKLIKAHHENIKKNKAQERKEIKKLQYKVNVLRKKRLNVCISCGNSKELEREDKRICGLCQKKKYEYKKKLKKTNEVN